MIHVQEPIFLMVPRYFNNQINNSITTINSKVRETVHVINQLVKKQMGPIAIQKTFHKPIGSIKNWIVNSIQLEATIMPINNQLLQAYLFWQDCLRQLFLFSYKPLGKIKTCKLIHQDSYSLFVWLRQDIVGPHLYKRLI